MSLKKYLVNLIRGWLPKEPSLSRSQQATNSKVWRIRKIEFVLILFIGGFAGGLLGALVSSLGLFSGLGIYVWPMIIGVVIGIVAAAILIRNRQKEEQQKGIRELKS